MTKERVEGLEKNRVCPHCPLKSDRPYYVDSRKPKCGDEGILKCNRILGSTHPDPGLSTSGFTPDGQRVRIESEPGKRRSG